MSTFGAMESFIHSFIAKTASLAIRTNRYMPGVDEYFILKWMQIIAATLIRAQASAARSVIFFFFFFFDNNTSIEHSDKNIEGAWPSQTA
jgi:hypothetical protein